MERFCTLCGEGIAVYTDQPQAPYGLSQKEASIWQCSGCGLMYHGENPGVANKEESFSTKFEEIKLAIAALEGKIAKLQFGDPMIIKNKENEEAIK